MFSDSDRQRPLPIPTPPPPSPPLPPSAKAVNFYAVSLFEGPRISAAAARVTDRVSVRVTGRVAVPVTVRVTTQHAYSRFLIMVILALSSHPKKQKEEKTLSNLPPSAVGSGDVCNSWVRSC